VVETHKTYDKTVFYKSNDVSQVLQVFNTPEEREKVRNDICRYAADGFQGVIASGLTPPTKHIVSRRFLKTRPPGYNKFPPQQLTELINEISNSPLAEGLLVYHYNYLLLLLLLLVISY